MAPSFHLSRSWFLHIYQEGLNLNIKSPFCSNNPNALPYSSGSVVKNLPARQETQEMQVRFPGWGRSPGGGNGNPLQNSCLEKPMDRGAWRATVHRVAKSQPRDSPESSLTPQFKSINSSVLSFLYSPTLTSIHDYWKNHSLD